MILLYCSLNQNIRSCEEERDSKLSSWRGMCKPVSDWLDQAENIVSSCEVSGSGLENTRKQREKIKVFRTSYNKVVIHHLINCKLFAMKYR